jgi:hypothetical protein
MKFLDLNFKVKINHSWADNIRDNDFIRIYLPINYSTVEYISGLSYTFKKKKTE